jgi:hypothetical protein
VVAEAPCIAAVAVAVIAPAVVPDAMPLMAITPAIVVEVVLAIVPVVADVARLAILRALDLRGFAAAQAAVGLRALFHAVDVRLAAFQAARLVSRERAGALALGNAPALLGLALVDVLLRAGGGRVQVRGLRECRRGEAGREEDEQDAGRHGGISGG